MADIKTNITVQLTGTDGNIFAIIAKVRVNCGYQGCSISQFDCSIKKITKIKSD